MKLDVVHEQLVRATKISDLQLRPISFVEKLRSLNDMIHQSMCMGRSESTRLALITIGSRSAATEVA